MSNLQNRIDNYFRQLEKFINKLPLTEKGKKYIWFDSFIRFYDEPVLDEKGNTTYGIQTEWQLQRFIEQFKQNLQKSRLKAIEKWTDELNKIEPDEAISEIDRHLYDLKKKELLSEIGGESTNDWQKWLEKYLSNELGWQQKRLTKKPLKQEIKGFYSGLNDNHIKNLYEQMQDYFRGNFESFKAIFKPLSIVKNFEKVIWLKRPTHLREFFTLLDIIPTQKIVDGLISDEKGNNIHLPKPKRKEYSKYYSEMEKIVNTIKKTDL